MDIHKADIGDYKPGSVTHVKLKNFLTYTHVEFSPGARLNMVIGANGTGKSTILCALCLGLGGEPKLLGRADDVRSFIMHEKKVATIELTLAPLPGKPVHVLKRKIDREKGSERGNGRGSSTFYINDQKCKLSDVQELVKGTYKVMVENLLSFLPQDKVGSFSGFGPKELLEETEKVLAGDQRIYKEHVSLIEAEQELSSGDHNVGTIQAKLEKLMAERQRFEREKERMEEREQAVQQVDLLKKSLLWKQYNKLQGEVIDLKKEKNQAKQDFKEAREELQPLEEEAQEYDARKAEIEANIKKLDQQSKRYQQEMNKSEQKHENFDDAIENIMTELRMVEAERARRIAQNEAAKKKVQDIEGHLSEIRSQQDIEKEYTEATQEKRSAHRVVQSARQEVGRLQRDFNELSSKNDNLAGELARLNDEKTQRRERIHHKNPQVGKIMKWLDENRKLFRHEVFGPVAYEVSSNSKNAAAFLEAHIPRNLLYSFIVSDKADYDLLFAKVRGELKLPISINLVRGERELKRPYGDAKYEKLKSDYGVIGYLDESITAPEPVMQALRSFAQVHRVLIGGEETQKSLDERGLLDFLSAPDKSLNQHGKQQSCIFACSRNRTKKYTQSVSRYSKDISSRIDDVDQARVLAPGVDPQVKADLEAQLKTIHDEINVVRPALQDAEKKKHDAEQHGQQVSMRAQKAKESKEMLAKLQHKLTNAEAKLKATEEDLEQDDENTKRELAQKMMTKVAESITALEHHQNAHEKLLQATYASAGVRINRDAVAFKSRKINELLLQKKTNIDQLEKDAQEKQNLFHVKKIELKKLKEHNDKEAPLYDEEGNPTSLMNEMEKLENLDSIEDVEAAIEDKQAIVDSYHHDPNAIRQYKKNLADIEQVEAQLEQVMGSKEALDRKIQTKLTPWKETLEKSLSQANTLFSNYMEEVGCTGEVRLRKGGESGNEDCDFKNWGVEIRVSFREGVKAQVLSAQVQSGGERSVSTIMYLMALQEMMVTPFRCVDEINQGLDEKNERLVFKRIVLNSCQPPNSDDATDHCGQYFLITPKLLPNLKDMEHPAVTVLLVMNGPFNFASPTDFNVDELVKKRRNYAANDEDENQADSNKQRSGQRKKKRRSS
ncbi:of chromosomes protein 5 [Seminavis robusta]|uniref:Structural maintenance of chromosomes protein 5 n=1 Tax=Seminavis robusta TaxID=568900 RepID=A0A9N8DAK5_9STRA|nr:of chromosomes protein 5 [Seminavis robusta]|eukprot:Sro61_g035110.1 of chromosomes protein 5 (1121) ;mRNA; r:94864-99237